MPGKSCDTIDIELPTRENVLIALIYVMVRGGNKSGAKDVYDRLRKTIDSPYGFKRLLRPRLAVKLGRPGLYIGDALFLIGRIIIAPQQKLKNMM